MDGDGREGVEEEGRELVQAVEHQRVLPDHDGEHQRSHAEDIVSLVGAVFSFLLINTEIYPGLSLVKLLHYCPLIGRELQRG